VHSTTIIYIPVNYTINSSKDKWQYSVSSNVIDGIYGKYIPLITFIETPWKNAPESSLSSARIG